MFRKIASFSVALIVAGGVLVAAPAQAATKVTNGVACTKSGATTKTSAGSYKCAKNPLVSSTKLTWLKIDCINTANAAVKAQKDANISAANFKAQLPIIDLGITTETANRAEIQVKLDNANARLPGATTDLEAAKIKLAAAVTAAEITTAKKVVADLTSAVANWTAAARAYASKIRSIEQTIKKLEAAKLVAISKPAELTRNVTSARDSAKLICTKGL
jgi:hypothetical protein